MRKRISLLSFLFIVGVCCTACSAPQPTAVEVTRIVKETVVFPMPQTVVVRPAVEGTPSVSARCPSNVNLGYYEGIRVITQYYTFLDRGLYAEAYALLSRQGNYEKNLDEFIANKKALKITSIKIISLMPYYEYAEQVRGQPATIDAPEKLRFVAETIWKGEEKMVGSVFRGDLQHNYVTLVEENGEWKILAFDTATGP